MRAGWLFGIIRYSLKNGGAAWADRITAGAAKPAAVPPTVFRKPRRPRLSVIVRCMVCLPLLAASMGDARQLLSTPAAFD